SQATESGLHYISRANQTRPRMSGNADPGLEAGVATIRDRDRRQNAVTLNHQQAIYTEKLRPSAPKENPGCCIVCFRHAGLDVVPSMSSQRTETCARRCFCGESFQPFGLA